jgi:hypothetical protein
MDTAVWQQPSISYVDLTMAWQAPQRSQPQCTIRGRWISSPYIASGHNKRGFIGWKHFETAFKRM